MWFVDVSSQHGLERDLWRAYMWCRFVQRWWEWKWQQSGIVKISTDLRSCQLSSDYMDRSGVHYLKQSVLLSTGQMNPLSLIVRTRHEVAREPLREQLTRSKYFSSDYGNFYVSLDQSADRHFPREWVWHEWHQWLHMDLDKEWPSSPSIAFWPLRETIESDSC